MMKLLHPVLLSAAIGHVHAAPTADGYYADLHPRATSFPFNKVVAFGDDYTDNGQGSYAHGITGNETTGALKHLWGANTWTDGFVPVTYLAGSLNMPLTYDYAFGSSEGAQYIGSVCDTSLVPKSQRGDYAQLLNGKIVPDVLQQITNYTKNGVFDKNVADTLHFLWTANNDMIASLYTGGRFEICSTASSCRATQTTFITQVIGCMKKAITKLIQAGAEHIFVPNAYPRQLAPWTTQYITQNAATIANFKAVITLYNVELEALTKALAAKYNVKVIYYDANAFLTAAYSQPSMVDGAAYSYTCVDGCSQQVSSSDSNFDMWYTNTLIDHEPDQFFWMTSVVASTTVLKYLAADMYTYLAAQY